MIDYEDRPIPDRVRPLIDSPDFIVTPRGYRHVSEADLTMSPYPLIGAINAAKGYFGTVTVEVRGRIPGGGQQLGGGDAGQKQYKAHWDGNPISLVIYGAGEDAEINEIGLHTHDGGSPTGGIEYLRLHNLTIRNNWGDRCIGSPANETHDQSGAMGVLHLTDVQLRGRDDNSHGGFGMKFGIRSLAGISYRVDGLICHGAQEHCIYVNTPQAGGDGCSSFRRIWHKGSWRTCLQIVDRPIESALPEPTAHLYFEDIVAHNVNGEGGGGITIAGHWGPITIADYYYGKGSKHSALAIWHPLNPHQGFRADPEGYYNGSVILHNFRVETPLANQDAIQVDRARRLQVSRRFDIDTSKTHFDLGKVGDYKQPLSQNEAIGFEWADPPGLSRHPGFRGGGRKVTADVWNDKTNAINPNVTLSNTEIDDLYMLPMP